MKPYGISTKFLKGRPFKKDHIKGPLKKLGVKNWWEEIADSVWKKNARRDAKQQIRKDLNDL